MPGVQNNEYLFPHYCMTKATTQWSFIEQKISFSSLKTKIKLLYVHANIHWTSVYNSQIGEESKDYIIDGL